MDDKYKIIKKLEDKILDPTNEPSEVFEDFITKYGYITDKKEAIEALCISDFIWPVLDSKLREDEEIILYHQPTYIHEIVGYEKIKGLKYKEKYYEYFPCIGYDFKNYESQKYYGYDESVLDDYKILQKPKSVKFDNDEFRDLYYDVQKKLFSCTNTSKYGYVVADRDNLDNIIQTYYGMYIKKLIRRN